MLMEVDEDALQNCSRQSQTRGARGKEKKTKPKVDRTGGARRVRNDPKSLGAEAEGMNKSPDREEDSQQNRLEFESQERQHELCQSQHDLAEGDGNDEQEQSTKRQQGRNHDWLPDMPDDDMLSQINNWDGGEMG
jgi:hypothetical protein